MQWGFLLLLSAAVMVAMLLHRRTSSLATLRCSAIHILGLAHGAQLLNYAICMFYKHFYLFWLSHNM